MRKILGMALVLALGCGDDKSPSTGGGTDESTGGTSGGTTQTTEPTSTSGTTDDSGTMGGTQTTAPTSTSTTTSTTTEETTRTAAPETSGPETTGETGGSTTGGGDGMIDDDCAAACDKFTECQLGPDPAMCVPSCVDDLGGAQGECVPATEAYLQCIGSMTCDQLVAFFEDMDPGPCADELQAFGTACQNGGDCSVGQGSNPQGTECSFSVQCPGDPLLEMTCDKNECVCMIDGMQAGDPCPAENICKMEAALADKADACCGFGP